MRAALDTVMNSKDSRFERLMYIHDTFGFLIQMKTLMVMNDTQDEGAWASDLETKCINFAKVYPGDVDGNCLAKEIQDCQVLIQKYASSVDLTLLGVLKFIVSYGGNDVHCVSKFENWAAVTTHNIDVCSWVRMIIFENETNSHLPAVNHDGKTTYQFGTTFN
jgi:hypothetical protein